MTTNQNQETTTEDQIDVRPLLDWPNHASILNKVLGLIEHATSATDPVQEGDDPALTLEQARRAAPDLARAIHAAMDRVDLPDALLQRLDQKNDECAQDALDALDTIQRRTLVETCRQELERQDAAVE